MAIKIGAIGYNHSHEADFTMNLPDGPGAYLFILVKSAAVFVINSQAYPVKKDSYVMLRRKTPCSYRAAREKYTDDWFYFDMNDGDDFLLTEKGLVFDQPVYIGSRAEELSSLLHQISFEHYSADLLHEELKHHFTEIFLLKLSRAVLSKNVPSPEVLSSKNDKITYLRTRIYEEPGLFTSVDEMAAFAGLSRSGFQHLYKKTFGINVLEDVIQGRIEKAKSLLSRSNLSVSEISEKCGYKTEFHFMRQFKEKTSFTPTEFRNGDTWLQVERSRS